MNGQQNSCKLKRHKYLLYIKQPFEKTNGGHSQPTAPQKKDATELDKQLTKMILIPQNKRTRIQKLQNTENFGRYRIKIANNPPAEKGCSDKIMIKNKLIFSGLVYTRLNLKKCVSSALLFVWFYSISHRLICFF